VEEDDFGFVVKKANRRSGSVEQFKSTSLNNSTQEKPGGDSSSSKQLEIVRFFERFKMPIGRFQQPSKKQPKFSSTNTLRGKSRE
jgi:hypothetical protein